MEKKQVGLLTLEIIVFFLLVYITVNLHNLPSLGGFAVFENQANPGNGGIPDEFRLKITDLKMQDFEKVVYLTNNIEKKEYITVNNTGTENLTDVYIDLEGIDKKDRTISPLYYKALKAGETGKFEITFFFSDLSGEKAFNYTAVSGNLVKKENAKLVAFTMSEFFSIKIEQLKEEIQSIRERTSNPNVIGSAAECEKTIAQIEKSLDAGDFIEIRTELNNADSCIAKTEDALNIAELPIARAQMSGKLWIITWSLITILIAAIIVLAYFIRQKSSLISFLDFETKNIHQEKLSPSEEDNAFEERLKRISDKLKD